MPVKSKIQKQMMSALEAEGKMGKGTAEKMLKIMPKGMPLPGHTKAMKTLLSKKRKKTLVTE